MENGYDGSVIIGAEIDESGVREGIASLRALLGSFSEYMGSLTEEMQRAASSAAASMPKTAGSAAAMLASGLNSGRSLIGSAARGLLGAVQTVFGDAGGSFMQVGRGIVSGIIGGITGASSGLFAALKSLAADILSTLKGALGIHSPSRLMRDAVGLNIGLGIREGLLASMTAVSDAAQTMSGMLVSTLAGDAYSTGGSAVRAGLSRNPGMTAGTVMAGTMLYAGAAARETGDARRSGISGNTFIFNKPVETPYAHAKEIRDTMEAILYGA